MGVPAAARNSAHSLLHWSLGRLTVVGTALARSGPRKSERESAHYPRLTAPLCALSSCAVTAHMQQRVGAAVVTACATYGDKALDLFTSVKYETEAIQVLVAVYGIAI